MSYNLESKKRKFDRILESLTEPSAPQQPKPTTDTRTPLSSRLNASSLRTVSLDTLTSKRRRVTPSTAPGKSTSNTSLLNVYLPSSRAAFLERLETYRHITKWHVPSTSSINAAEWAKRGWVCADVDTVSCGSCSVRMLIDLSVEDRHREELNTSEEGAEDTQKEVNEDDSDDMAVEVYDALVKRYHDMITTAHAESCSWRKRGCDASIQRVEGLLNTSSTISAMQQRLTGMTEKIDDIPTVSDLPAYDDLTAPDLTDIGEMGAGSNNKDALKLAICGWQYKEADVIECKHCFRSLGLWLYRGENPTVENLDAVDSHLEYCPWRSPEAQDTELIVHLDTSRENGKKVKMPGWALVYHAIKKQSLKKKDGTDTPKSSIQLLDDASREQVSPEQRERKMKDLMRRIKEIKKPFNVKSLLRKKDTTVA